MEIYADESKILVIVNFVNEETRVQKDFHEFVCWKSRVIDLGRFNVWCKYLDSQEESKNSEVTKCICENVKEKKYLECLREFLREIFMSKLYTFVVRSEPLKWKSGIQVKKWCECIRESIKKYFWLW